MRRGLGVGAVAALMLWSVSLAMGEAPTRSDYVNRLERICRPGALATQRVMKGTRTEIRKEQLDAAAGKFDEADSIFSQTLRRIKTVDRPEADRARLKKWFGFLQRQATYLGEIAVQLQENHVIKAQRLITRFIHNGRLANNVVIAFSFDYCSFKFSRYG
jgi:hypothetical protein